jgi:hypothetical protein
MMAHDKALKTRRDEAQLADVERQVDELVAQIQQDSTYAPRLNRHCADCDYLWDCPLRTEVEAALAGGRLQHAGFAAPEA